MEKLEELRRRLADLTTAGLESSSSSPAESLAACRSFQDQLRTLKRDVLTRLLVLRGRAQERAWKSVGESRPSLPDLGERRGERAKKLLADVRDRVTGLLGDDGAAEVEAWAEVNREIDVRLDHLAALEPRLVRAVEEGETAVPPPVDQRDESGDDLYAAVGAAVRRGHRGGFCPHCGQGVDSDDRFCRHCGHRLQTKKGAP